MATEPNYASVKDIHPGQKNINLVFIVLEIGKPNRTKDGHEVRSCKVADKSGSINISIWDDIGDVLQTGDICRLVKGYASVFKDCLTLYTGKGGEVHKIGEFCLQFSELPNMSEPNAELTSKMHEHQQQRQQRKSPTEQNNSQTGGAHTDGPGQGSAPPHTQAQHPAMRGGGGLLPAPNGQTTVPPLMQTPMPSWPGANNGNRPQARYSSDPRTARPRMPNVHPYSTNGVGMRGHMGGMFPGGGGGGGRERGPRR